SGENATHQTCSVCPESLRSSLAEMDGPAAGASDRPRHAAAPRSGASASAAIDRPNGFMGSRPARSKAGPRARGSLERAAGGGDPPLEEIRVRTRQARDAEPRQRAIEVAVLDDERSRELVAEPLLELRALRHEPRR